MGYVSCLEDRDSPQNRDANNVSWPATEVTKDLEAKVTVSWIQFLENDGSRVQGLQGAGLVILMAIYGYFPGSTISTLLHDRINPKDCQVLFLGDSGFLQFFSVVSRDYGTPRFLLEIANLQTCQISKSGGCDFTNRP